LYPKIFVLRLQVMEKNFLRIAHISDLHYSKTSWNPLQFFSKRWIGNLNLLLSRKKEYEHQRLLSLPEFFKNASVSHVLITGDLSTTSLEQEFDLAADFISSLKAAGLSVLTIPGNHDQYTKKVYRDSLFYQFFDASFSGKNQLEQKWNLKEHKVAIKQLNDNWKLVLLDTAIATPFYSSRGLFSLEAEKNLEAALSEIALDQNVLLANHFPFFEGDSDRTTLLRSEHLRALVKRFSQIKIYLHGHTHRHCIADLRSSGYPIVLDSGSTPHRSKGAINLIEISKEGCDIQVLQWKSGENAQPSQWQASRHVNCPWSIR